MKYEKCIMKFLTTNLQIVDIFFLACFTHHLTCGCSSLTHFELKLKAELITFFSLRNKDVLLIEIRNLYYTIPARSQQNTDNCCLIDMIKPRISELFESLKSLILLNCLWMYIFKDVPKNRIHC